METTQIKVFDNIERKEIGIFKTKEQARKWLANHIDVNFGHYIEYPVEEYSETLEELCNVYDFYFTI